MKKNTHTISILGLGYVGLCTAAVFAAKGIRTTGIDVDREKVGRIAAGKPPFHEPGLAQLLKVALRRKRLHITDDTTEIEKTDITLLTVGTPSQPDGSIDLSQVEKASRTLGSLLSDKATYHLVVVKSTVIPGTTTSKVKPILEKESSKTIGKSLGLVSNPEFLKEGTAIQDTLSPDKLVIGAADKKSQSTLLQLYRRFYGKKQPPTILTTPETAEMIKYASNSFLATKISYINTIANICQHILGVDVEKIAEAIGHDPRIGPLFLKAGPGYGGSCFHKDLQALISYSLTQGYDPALLRATEQVNEQQASRVVDLAEKLLGNLNDRRIAVLGLAFKNNTDDIREAPSIRVIDHLQKKGAHVVAYDPMAVPNARKLLADTVEFSAEPRAAIKGADCCIIMTEWDEFRRLKEKDFMAQMKLPNLVDARKIYDPTSFKDSNFAAIGLGRSS